MKCFRCFGIALGKRRRTLGIKAIAEVPDAVTVGRLGAYCAEHAAEAVRWQQGRD